MVAPFAIGRWPVEWRAGSRGRRQRAQVVDDVPPIVRGNEIFKCRHRFAARGDFPKQSAVGLAGDVRIGKVFGPGVQVLGRGAVALAGVAVTLQALGEIDGLAGGDGIVVGGNGIFLSAARAGATQGGLLASSAIMTSDGNTVAKRNMLK